jgi:acyl transferase domain-containing protein
MKREGFCVDDELLGKMRAALTRSRDEIRRLMNERDALRVPVAIVGAACRLPGGVRSPADLHRRLMEGWNGIGEAPQGRLDLEPWFASEGGVGKTYVKQAAWLDTETVERFDAAFFRVSPAEAVATSPSQRMLMETVWNAFEDAAIPPSSLAGRKVGVFVGQGPDDFTFHHIGHRRPERIDAYSLTGVMPCIASGRLSHAFGFHGPSLTLDTGCSSSLYTLGLAVESLRRGECDVAVAAGVNLFFRASSFVALSAMRALSPDGRSKAFDNAADGFGRGEGCVAVLLKRLPDARREGDPVRADILSVALGHDGRSAGLTAPHGPAQTMVIRDAMSIAGLEPEAVGMVETHGTGTPLGDPIEAGALSVAMGKRSHPLWLGAVKANFGHTEAAAGLLGLIKAMLAVENGVIYPHPCFSSPSKHIDWINSGLAVNPEAESWPDSYPRVAGVSAFSLSGANAHALLRQTDKPQPNENIFVGTLFPLRLSARDEASLARLGRSYLNWLSETPARIDDISATTMAGRQKFPVQIIVQGVDKEDWKAKLCAFLSGEKKREDFPPPIHEDTNIKGMRLNSLPCYEFDPTRFDSAVDNQDTGAAPLSERPIQLADCPELLRLQRATLDSLLKLGNANS